MQREDWDKRYASVENLWATKPNRFLVSEVADLTPGSALDLACGEGQNAIWLATLGWEVTGVDYSEVAIAKAEARAERDGVQADFVCADLVVVRARGRRIRPRARPLPPHPQGERREVLESAAAALAPGGTFFLLGHDSTNLADGVGGPSDPAILYTPDDIAHELPGLEIEKAERVRRDVRGEERDAIDAMVTARRPPPS